MKKLLFLVMFVFLGTSLNAETFAAGGAVMTLNGDTATITTSDGIEAFDVAEVNENCWMLLDESGVASNVYCYTAAGIGPIFQASTADEFIRQ